MSKWMYDKNCGKKIFDRKMYSAPEKKVDQVAFKGIGGKGQDLC